MNSQSFIKTCSQVYTTRFLNRKWISKEVFEVELTRPPLFSYEAGQGICLTHETVEKYYHLISLMKDPKLKLFVHYQNETISKQLSYAKKGTNFKFTGPHGYFTFKPSPRSPIFIASGSGIAPFFAICQSGVTGFTLLHEVKTVEELYYRSFFRRYAKLYIPCFIENMPKSRITADTFLGSSAKYLKEHLLPMPYDFYLCGRPEIIREVTHLVDESFPGSFIFREVFY